jgi:hypothetical protein
VKNSLRLRNAEGPKNTFPELVVEKRFKYSECKVVPPYDGYARSGGSPLTHYGPSFSGCGRLFSGCERLDDLPSHLQHYINRRVGVKLPQHLLLLHCCAAKKFDHNQSLSTVFSIQASFFFSFVTGGSFGKDRK